MKHSIALILTLAGICLTPSAQGQGTSGQLPDPMSTAELTRLLNLYAKPDSAQWATIESMHDDYRTQFRTLREGDMQKFLEEMQSFMGRVPTKQQVTDFVRKYDRINDKIAELDNGLFDAIGTLLGEARQPAVKRAKDARTRSRTMFGMFGQLPGLGGNAPDLAAIILESKLPAAELDPLQPELVAYEDRLTAHTRELSGSGMRMMIEMVDALEKAGLGNLDNEAMEADPAKMAQVMEIVQASMASAMKPVMEKASQISALNQSTFRAIAPRLSPDNARRLRVRYVSSAYAEIGPDPMNTESLLRAALRIRSLDSDTKARLQDIYASWQRADDALVDEAIKEIDESRKDFNPMDFGGMSDRMEKMQERATKRSEVAEKALASAKAIIGDERLEKLMTKAMTAKADMFDDTSDPEVATEPEVETPGIAVRAGEAEMFEYGSPSGDRQPAISASTLQALVSTMGLDDGMRAAAETIHGDYLKRWTEEVESIREKMTVAQQGMWSFSGGEDGAVTPVAAKRDEYYTLRKLAAEKSSAADKAFFQDLLLVLGEDKKSEIEFAKLDRLLAGRTTNPAMAGSWMMEEAVPVNVVELVRDSEITAEERTKMVAVVAPRVEEVAALSKELADAEIQYELDVQIVSEEQQKLYASGETPDAVAMQAMSKRWMELQAQLSGVKNKHNALMREIWNSMLGTVNASTKDQLELAYSIAAFPAIFKDPRSATSYIDRAMQMSDLTDAQRQELTVLNEKYRAEYNEFCRRMVPSRTEAPNETDAAAMQEYWQKRMANENERAKIRFDRDERSQRAVSQLKRILTPEQVKRIGGLEDYEKADKSEQAQTILD